MASIADNPFLLQTEDNIISTSFKPKMKILDTRLGVIELFEDAEIVDCKIENITSAANLRLINCHISKKVIGKNLLLERCSAKSAEAQESAWLFAKIGPDGSAQLFPIKTGRNFVGILPPGTKHIIHTNTTFVKNVDLHKGFETSSFKDCIIKGDIIFEKDPTSSVIKKAILQGNTVFEGKITGGILVDERNLISTTSSEDEEVPT